MVSLVGVGTSCLLLYNIIMICLWVVNVSVAPFLFTFSYFAIYGKYSFTLTHSPTHSLT